MTDAIVAENLRKRYGDKAALDGLASTRAAAPRCGRRSAHSSAVVRRSC
ncbi:hypothetical protein M2271_004332 [Streptomyces sp. LBL]|nr:hypothetical protein [Streptomyces sp. LBL]